jgi:hypothetical protein
MLLLRTVALLIPLQSRTLRVRHSHHAWGHLCPPYVPWFLL